MFMCVCLVCLPQIGAHADSVCHLALVLIVCLVPHECMGVPVLCLCIPRECEFCVCVSVHVSGV